VQTKEALYLVHPQGFSPSVTHGIQNLQEHADAE